MEQTVLTRRSFMRGLAAAGAGALAGGCASLGGGARLPRLACQMWSVDDIWRKDPDGALAKMRAMGFEGVQSMAFWNWERPKLHALLDAHGMALIDMPVHLDNHVTPAKLASTVDFCKEFGIDFVFVPWLDGKKLKTVDAMKRLADDMVAAAGRLAPYGIKMGFHNHQVEFRQKVDGVSAMDVFMARPELNFELDVGHATLAGADPVAVLGRLRGRVPSIHAKPGGGRSCGGEGDRNDWPKIFAACRAAGVRWAVVECETRRNTFDDILASSKFLATL